MEKHGRPQTLLKAECEDVQSDITCEAIRQLNGYFRRERQSFDVPLLFAGMEFQKRVWNRLLEVFYGTTLSYGDMYGTVARPSESRPCRGERQWGECHFAFRSLPPCHGKQWFADRIRGRHGNEKVSAGIRNGSECCTSGYSVSLRLCVRYGLSSLTFLPICL